jgi:hypothetical protein
VIQIEQDNAQPDSNGDPLPAVRNAQLKDICIIHHPSALEDEQRFSFEEFCSHPEGKEQDQQAILDLFAHEAPWNPFPTRLDFDLAEVMLDSHMNTKQIERTISLFRQVLPNPDNSTTFTISNGTDLTKMWDAARRTRTSGVRLFYMPFLSTTSHLMFNS